MLSTHVKIQRMQEIKKQREVSRTKLRKRSENNSYEDYYNTGFSLHSEGKITYKILSEITLS